MLFNNLEEGGCGDLWDRVPLYEAVNRENIEKDSEEVSSSDAKKKNQLLDQDHLDSNLLNHRQMEDHLDSHLLNHRQQQRSQQLQKQ